MIVHQVTIGEQTSAPQAARVQKRVYVGGAAADIRYRDMLVCGRHRWELYSEPEIDFITVDPQGMDLDQCRSVIETQIRTADGVMMVVSAKTGKDPLAQWEIECAVSNGKPLVGVDIGKSTHDVIPRDLVGKMTNYGWEWFAAFFNRI